MKNRVIIPLILFLVLGYTSVYSNKIIIDKNLTSKIIAHEIYFLEDATGKLEFADVLHSTEFIFLNKELVNFKVSRSTFWLKFVVRNKDNHKQNFIEIAQPLLHVVDLYYVDSNNNYKVVYAGQRFPYNDRKYKKNTNFLFELDLKSGEEKTFLLKIKGEEQVLIPIQIISSDTLDSTLLSRNLWFGIYCGIILVMVLYNIFIYLSIRDKSYLYYVLHTLFVGLTQASLLGFTYKYLWPESPWFGNYSNFLFTCLVSIVGVQFLIEFMRLRETARVIFKILKVFQCVYVFYLFSSLAGYYSITYGAIMATQSIIAIFILGISIHLYRKGYAEAKYYLIGWSSLMLGIIMYVAMNYGFLPYSNLTAYSLLFGSAAEVTLLSFALADKINIYKLDKETSQEEALSALRENERMVREQNLFLEIKVTERTQELSIVNDDLNKVLKDLRDAEGYLVESEKMAALGQLTAGIAHEINNPINFVTSNVTPLRRDIDMLLDIISTTEEIGLSEGSSGEKQQKIDDYKEEVEFDYLKVEINHLLKGIQEGAFRTAEIVKGLRIFSRIDEDDLKKADINESLDSTLVLVNNLLTNKIALVKEYSDIPLIECYPGKLNQVFLNVISNAIQAINERHGEEPVGVLKINTSLSDTRVLVKVTDNGTGMDENTKKKIFEPFFTTKDVGKGTGLGMSIAYNIIKKHNGQIFVNSTLGAGTEFVLDLPILHSIQAN
ncbi:MAG: 7TM diverse intracellular signaling domain-containing protein [Chitinophagaceae bacterium]